MLWVFFFLHIEGKAMYPQKDTNRFITILALLRWSGPQLAVAPMYGCIYPGITIHQPQLSHLCDSDRWDPLRSTWAPQKGFIFLNVSHPLVGDGLEAVVDETGRR